MEKSRGEIIKKYVIVSGFWATDNNRGTAALSYGSVPFLQEHGFLKDGQKLLNFSYYKNPFKKCNRTDLSERFLINGKEWCHVRVKIFVIEKWIFTKLGIILPFSKLNKFMDQVDIVAAINGGDGFSDIYNTFTFKSRLTDSLLAMKCDLPLIILPQTLGPFKHSNNYILASKILHYASRIYVRDDKFNKELDIMHLKYEQTKDLSFYMKPQPWDINIRPKSIGLNISGLAYYNQFRTLAGQFAFYPQLVFAIIEHFQRKGVYIYLIPHSYNFSKPEINNDDLEAAREVYSKLKSTRNILLIDEDMLSPQIKYLISKMAFFIGTRMHANFAAIYTGIPLFGLAYSYKFQGAFEAHGIYGQTSMINNINGEDIEAIIELIDNTYCKYSI